MVNRNVARIPHRRAHGFFYMLCGDALTQVVLTRVAYDRARDLEAHAPQLALVRVDAAQVETFLSHEAPRVVAATWNISDDFFGC